MMKFPKNPWVRNVTTAFPISMSAISYLPGLVFLVLVFQIFISDFAQWVFLLIIRFFRIFWTRENIEDLVKRTI